MRPATSQFLFSIFIFSITFLHFSLTCSGNNTVHGSQIEKEALLSFKHSVKYSSNGSTDILSSWKDQVDCCEWEGIVCSNLTGHVIELHLQSRDDSSGLHGKLDGSLLNNLTHIRYLDLSNNMFEGNIPSFIRSFAKLEFLNLSNTGFDIDNLKWLSRLSHLEQLDMSNLDLSRAVNWQEEINVLPSLVELHFQSSGLSGKLGNSLSNLRHLKYLDLSLNDFEGPIPDSIGSFAKLEYLDLSYSGFNGTTPHAIGNLSSLLTLVLAGSIRNIDSLDWLSGLPSLERLDMTQVNLSRATNWLQVINTLPSLLEQTYKLAVSFLLQYH